MEFPNLAELPSIPCPKCGHFYYKKLAVLKRVPGLMVGQSTDIYQYCDVVACEKCSYVENEEMITQGLKKEIPKLTLEP